MNVLQERLASTPLRYDSAPSNRLTLELQRVLNPTEADFMASGSELRFGSDYQAFLHTINAFGLEELICRDNAPMHIHQVSSVSGGSYRYLGRSIDSLRKLSIPAALNVLQAEYWEVTEGYLGRPRLLMPERPVTSRLLLAHGNEVDGEREADLENPGVYLTQTHFYDASILEYEEPDSAIESPAAIIAREDVSHREERVSRLANYISANGCGLGMPYSSYRMSVGRLIRGDNFLGYGAVSVDQAFLLEQGEFALLS